MSLQARGCRTSFYVGDHFSVLPVLEACASQAFSLMSLGGTVCTLAHSLGKPLLGRQQENFDDIVKRLTAQPIPHLATSPAIGTIPRKCGTHDPRWLALGYCLRTPQQTARDVTCDMPPLENKVVSARTHKYIDSPFLYGASAEQVTQARAFKDALAQVSQFQLPAERATIEVITAFLDALVDPPKDDQSGLMGKVFYGPILAWAWCRGMDYEMNGSYVLPKADWTEDWCAIATDALAAINTVLQQFNIRIARRPPNLTASTQHQQHGTCCCLLFRPRLGPNIPVVCCSGHSWTPTS